MQFFVKFGFWMLGFGVLGLLGVGIGIGDWGLGIECQRGRKGVRWRKYEGEF